ncbi:MAG TPA: thiamine-phosphate kinase [Thiothrix sp.]|nr:thiamine-phosphate kinase [Thiothrix sp.]
MSSEFDLINKWFNWPNTDPTVIKGVGDDAAILSVPEGKQLIVTSDTFISGVHFPHETKPHAIGHKALAVNLSDLAAMGAKPAWFTLALTLPEYNEAWLSAFSLGLKTLAQQHNIQLIGGDTTRGILSITITAMGLLLPEKSLLRSGAKHHDQLYVTGTLGDAAAGLAMLQQPLLTRSEQCIQQLDYPQPRVQHSHIIRDYATSCLDVSDGLLADLQHILTASKVGAVLDLACIPFSKPLQCMDKNTALHFALSGGDDYELLFSIPLDKQKEFEQHMQQQSLICYGIGHIDQYVHGIISRDQQPLTPKGYNHFIGMNH